MKICLFCGSSDDIDDIYRHFAKDLGNFLSGKNVEIYYGAGSTGLMGIFSREVVKNKKIIHGVIPKQTLISNMVNQDISQIFTTNCLSSRKKLMLMACDIFIVLPGGIGTVDEFFDVIAYKQINPDFLHKKCILVNINGYFDRLLQFFTITLNHGFTKTTDMQLFDVVNTIEEINKLIEKSISPRHNYD